MRFFASTNLMLFAIMLMLLQPVQANAYDVIIDDSYACINATQKIEKELQIKEHLLTTISTVESGKWNEAKKRNIAWPWTINAEGKGQFFKTKAEAIKTVRALRAKGVKSIDVGCMQINLSYHGDAFENLEEAFNPETNVRYGAKFLKKLYDQKGSWVEAAMAYHSSLPEKATLYKIKIAAAYEKVKRSHNSLEAKLFADRKISDNIKTARAEKENADKAVKIAEMEQKIEKQISAAKFARRDTKTKFDANEWREARLEEWRKSRIK